MVTDTGGSRWEEGENRVVDVTPELLKAPIDCMVDLWLEFERNDGAGSHTKVLVYPESVQGAWMHWVLDELNILGKGYRSKALIGAEVESINDAHRLPIS